MTPLILAAALSATPAAATEVLPTPPSLCAPDRTTRTLERERTRPRALGDLPKGRLIRTVLREQGGCAYMEVYSPAGWRMERAGVARRAATPVR